MLNQISLLEGENTTENNKHNSNDYSKKSKKSEENIKQDGREAVKTIISASRRTDIPAFYYDWLQERLAEGQAEIPNPRFPEKKYIVDLRPESVHSIVLWSKDFSRVLKSPMHLGNYNLYFQYTVNNYSKLLEPNVPDYTDTIKILEGLIKEYKPEQFNIRFDPIIISNSAEIRPSPEMPERARLIAFEQLCRDLCALGMETCRLTTSYIAMYGHVKSRLIKNNLDIIHLNEPMQLSFFSRMLEISDKYGLTLYSCASPVLEQVEGIKKGHCIDGTLLEELFGGKVKKAKDSGQRADCGCSGSRDIGIYSKTRDGMKCYHGCKYCYAMDSD